MSLNSVNVMGNLTRGTEIKHVPSGKAVCNFSIANNRVYVKNSKKVSEVSYFDVEVWGVAGENCAKYLTKGSGVIVEGRLKQERWEKDGKSYSHIKIVAGSVHFLPKKQKSNSVQDTTVSDSPSEEARVIAPEDAAWAE